MTVSPKGGGASIHGYSDNPPDIEWTLIPVEQKGVTFYIGKARV